MDPALARVIELYGMEITPALQEMVSGHCASTDLISWFYQRLGEPGWAKAFRSDVVQRFAAALTDSPTTLAGICCVDICLKEGGLAIPDWPSLAHIDQIVQNGLERFVRDYVTAALGSVDGREEANYRAAGFNSASAQWLTQRMQADGHYSAVELALLYVTRTSPHWTIYPAINVGVLPIVQLPPLANGKARSIYVLPAQVDEPIPLMDETNESSLYFYHGTTHHDADAILHEGVQLSRSRPGGKDFSMSARRGFYCTEHFADAARHLADLRPVAVLVFAVPAVVLARYRRVTFGKPGDNWAHFVQSCHANGPVHPAGLAVSLVDGPMSAARIQGVVCPYARPQMHRQWCVLDQPLADLFSQHIVAKLVITPK